MAFGITVRAQYSRVQAYLKAAPERGMVVGRLWREQGSEVTIGFMQGIVPVKTGFLRDSVTTEFTANGFSVYPTAPYAKFVDQPTRPHRIFPSKARVLRWFGEGGSPIFSAYTLHPGTKGVFFIKRTAEGIKQVLKQLYTMIWNERNRID
jgi:hypothetical protein